MFNKLKLVWLVAGRELKDQFRDWRVLMPMIILVFCFPVLMNEFDPRKTCAVLDHDHWVFPDHDLVGGGVGGICR